MFTLTSNSHAHPLFPSEAPALRIEEKPLTLEWCEKNLELASPGYVRPGPYRALPWQREIVNAWHYWDTVIQVGPVQVGKSVNFDMDMYYAQRVLGLNGMVAYAETGTVESVFNLRLKDMIRKNPCLRENWSGKEDDLTTENLKFLNCLWRIASAQNRNDLATFSAAITIGSEVAKWKRMKTFNPVLMLKGRGGAYNSTAQIKNLLESSPLEIGDYLYKETHKSGIIIVHPFYQCPHCGEWQEWTDRQIKLRYVDGIEPDHKPERIRALGEQAVYYECSKCKNEITEAERAGADKNVIWAAPKIEQEDFKQEQEVINSDGTIQGRLEGGKRRGYDGIAYQYPRLVDVSFQFYKCLALFFETVHDPEAKRTYETETMGRWPKRQGKRINVGFLESKKIKGYFQYGPSHKIPDNVCVLTYGGDTQKDGFYYGIFGWGYMMSCWLIRHDFIKLPHDPNESNQAVYAKFREALYSEPLLWANGTEADWRYGLQDRGGHRSDNVDFICKHMPNIKSYVGLSRFDSKMPPIFKSEKGDFFLGQPQMLSDFTGTLLGSDMMFFPEDTTEDFFDQIWRQFFEKRINARGEQEEVWIHGYAGDGKTNSQESGTGPDHYRDCFNLAYGAMKLSGMDKKLFNQDFCNAAKDNRQLIIPQKTMPENIPQQQQHQSQQPRRFDPRSRGGYFNRTSGRSFR